MDISAINTKVFSEAVALLNEAFPTDSEESVEWFIEAFANNHTTKEGARVFGIRVDFDFCHEYVYYHGNAEKFLDELKEKIQSYKEMS